jgi:ketosteroid isomerase-like protein
MSQEDVDALRRALDAWNRGDLAGWLAAADPEVEWVPAGPAAVERTVYRGHEEMAIGWRSLRETWMEFRFVESEVRDLGGFVLWLGHAHARGIASRLELDQEWAIVCELAGAKIIRIRSYLTWRDALEAVGSEG